MKIEEAIKNLKEHKQQIDNEYSVSIWSKSIEDVLKELEPIEEPKEIEKLDAVGCNLRIDDIWFPTENVVNDVMIEKINELVEAVNELKGKE